jgi:O-antigen/teichoic acid export membrane protein
VLPPSERNARVLAQASFYTAATAIVGILTAVSLAFIARHLTASEFGSFSFANSLLTLVALFFEFGLFFPAARIAARRGPTGRRRLAGAVVTAFVPVGILFCLSIVGMSAVVDRAFHVHVSYALLVVAPLSFVYPLKQVVLWLAQGLDRLHLYSLAAVIAQSLFLLLLVGGNHFARVTVARSLLLQATAMAAAWTLLLWWTRPIFRRARVRATTLVIQARRYGFQVYIGRVLSIGTYNMDVLMLGAFSTARSVALYSLAGGLVTAIGLPIAGLATALFPRMTRESRLSARWLALCWAIAIATTLLLVVLAQPLVSGIFSSSYDGAVSLVTPLALAQAIRSMTFVYNSFLSAHARGRDLRAAGFVLTGSNLILNFALIPAYGAAGAAWASLGAIVVNFVWYVVLYRRAVPMLTTARERTA